MVQVTLLVAEWRSVCPSAKSLWRSLRDKHDFEYSEVDVSSSDEEKLVEEHKIQSVPTTMIDGRVAFVGLPDHEEAVGQVKG